MSPISGYLTPEARATFDAVFAKLAAPGMCNSADETPCVSGTPSRAGHPGRHPQPRPSATTTPCSPPPAPYWRPASSVSTTGYPPASSSPPPARTRGGAGKGPHRRRHAVADVGCDPAGRPRPPLPGHLRQRQSPGALSHQAPGLTGPANRVVRQRPRVLVPRLHRARLPLRGPPLQPLRHQPRHRRQRPDFWPAAPTTNSPNKAGPPAKTATATPNGSHHHTSTTGSLASTPSTTPRNCCATTRRRRAGVS